MSTTSKTDVSHIIEGLKQLLQTDFLERPMEPEIGTNLGASLFEPNNETLQAVIKNRIIDAVEKYDDRVSVDTNDINFSVEYEDELRGILFAEINFYIVQYETYYSDTIKVGEING